MMLHLPRCCVAAVVVAACWPVAVSDAVDLPGYQTWAEFQASLEELAEHDRVALRSLGTTAQGRDIYLLTLSAGDADSKPAVLVMGSVDAANLVGSELAVRMARELATGEDGPAASLLEELTVYVIPRPSPDATERVWTEPTVANSTNTRATDADRDGAVDEDPPEDLNGDGVMTMMRVADATGRWMPHPDDPRVMVEADTQKNEAGKYRLLTEGIDNDQDDRFNEDGPGGVDFNRNFTFKYPYFAGDAGPHQVSEPETRAVVDWAMAQANVFLVFSFAPQDNLTRPWPASKDNGPRIKTEVLGDDAPYYKFLADLYADGPGAEHAPDAAAHDGAFAPWAYFHYGRWSVATRGWWIPKVESKSPADEEEGEDAAAEVEQDKPDDPAADGDEPADGDNGQPPDEEDQQSAADESTDDRAPRDRNALAWFDQQQIDGFVPWTEVDHPDFPDRRVEVGGFKPLVRQHPPADQLEQLASDHAAFLAEVAALRARLELETVKLESLGGGVHRLQATVVNHGYLPTASKMGDTAQRLRRLEIELTLPEGARLLVGDQRQGLGVVPGGGGQAEATWLFRLPAGTGQAELHLRAGEPSVGYCEQTKTISAADHSDNDTP